jgi:hypothetical protein
VRFSDISKGQQRHQQPHGDGPKDRNVDQQQQGSAPAGTSAPGLVVTAHAQPAEALALWGGPVAAAAGCAASASAAGEAASAAAAADKASTVIAAPTDSPQSPRAATGSLHAPVTQLPGSSPGPALHPITGVSQPHHRPGSTSTSRFFGPSPGLAPAATAAAAGVEQEPRGGWGLAAFRSSSSTSQRQQAVLTLEELAVSVPSLLVPPTVTRQQLQEGAVIAQVRALQGSSFCVSGDGGL